MLQCRWVVQTVLASMTTHTHLRALIFLHTACCPAKVAALSSTILIFPSLDLIASLPISGLQPVLALTAKHAACKGAGGSTVSDAGEGHPGCSCAGPERGQRQHRCG